MYLLCLLWFQKWGIWGAKRVHHHRCIHLTLVVSFVIQLGIKALLLFYVPFVPIVVSKNASI